LADDHERDNDQIVHYERGIPILNTRVDNLENEAREAKRRDEDYKKAQNKLNKLLVWFTGILAGVGIIGGAVSAYQAHVSKLNADAAQQNAIAAKENATAAKEMAAQMKQSSADTHDLALAAKSQADAASRQAAGTRQIVKLTQDT
jgi:putative IMPACT (imprinted ancient) family translation regulator